MNSDDLPCLYIRKDYLMVRKCYMRSREIWLLRRLKVIQDSPVSRSATFQLPTTRRFQPTTVQNAPRKCNFFQGIRVHFSEPVTQHPVLSTSLAAEARGCWGWSWLLSLPTHGPEHGCSCWYQGLFRSWPAGLHASKVETKLNPSVT